MANIRSVPTLPACACVYKFFFLFFFFGKVSLSSARMKPPPRAPPASSAWPVLLQAASVAACNCALTNCVIEYASLTKCQTKIEKQRGWARVATLRTPCKRMLMKSLPNSSSRGCTWPDSVYCLVPSASCPLPQPLFIVQG